MVLRKKKAAAMENCGIEMWRRRRGERGEVPLIYVCRKFNVILHKVDR